MMYIIVSDSGYRNRDVYVSIQPIKNPEGEQEQKFPVGFAWTTARGEAVRFPSRWHARAVARKLPGGGTIVAVWD